MASIMNSAIEFVWILGSIAALWFAFRMLRRTVVSYHGMKTLELRLQLASLQREGVVSADEGDRTRDLLEGNLDSANAIDSAYVALNVIWFLFSSVFSPPRPSSSLSPSTEESSLGDDSECSPPVQTILDQGNAALALRLIVQSPLITGTIALLVAVMILRYRAIYSFSGSPLELALRTLRTRLPSHA